MDKRFFVKNEDGLRGKWHIPTGRCRPLDDPAYNCAPLGDAGLCGRLNPGGKFPHVNEMENVGPEFACRVCIRKAGLDLHPLWNGRWPIPWQQAIRESQSEANDSEERSR